MPELNVFNGGKNTKLAPHLLQSTEAVEMTNADITSGIIKSLKKPELDTLGIKPYFHIYEITEDTDPDEEVYSPSISRHIPSFTQPTTFVEYNKHLLMSNNTEFNPEEIGHFSPKMKPAEDLFSGEVGYLATGLKDISLCRVGDTITSNPQSSNLKPLPGFIEPQPMVFMDLYPVNAKDFVKLTKALEKLKYFGIHTLMLNLKSINSSALPGSAQFSPDTRQVYLYSFSSLQ